jgi:imidazolonepropionase-like amidohydrolase
MRDWNNNEQYTVPITRLDRGMTLAHTPGGRDNSGDPPAALAIVGATIIDGTGAVPVEAGAVLMNRGEIIALGPVDEVVVPEGTTIIEASGRTIIPGIVESHIHVEDNIPAVLQAFLADGVTTVGNTGGSPSAVAIFKEASQQLNAARGFIAGPAVTAPGGYPSIRGDGSGAYGVATSAEGRAAVDYLETLGVDFIKIAQESFDFNFNSPGILPILEAEIVHAVVARAKERGFLVRSHVHQAEQLDLALDAGVASVEHMLFPLPPQSGYVELERTGELRLDSLPQLSERIDRMVRQGVYLVPTIGNELRNISYGLPGYPPDSLRAIEDFMVHVLQKYVKAGGMVALGSDWVGIPGVPPGMPRREMNYMIRAGMSTMQVIEASTRHASNVCGQSQKLGVLAVGRYADLLVLKGNPLQDLAALKSIEIVVKNGGVAASVENSRR